MSDVPVVVLAAGRGKRLSPHTDALPKCLVPVGNTTPLDWLLDSLERTARASEVILIVGHAREHIRDLLRRRGAAASRVRTVFNPDWDTTNNIRSADVARPHCAGAFVLINSDVICDPSIVAEALAPADQSFLVVDETRPPRAEAMKVRYGAGRLIAIAKSLDPDSADGEYIGITRFDEHGAQSFFDAIERLLAHGGSGEWYEAAIAEAAAEESIGMLATSGRAWIEIDDPSDLERAERDVLRRLRL